MFTENKLSKELAKAGWKFKPDKNFDIWHIEISGFHLKCDILKDGRGFFRAIKYTTIIFYLVKDTKVSSIEQIMILFNAKLDALNTTPIRCTDNLEIPQPTR